MDINQIIALRVAHKLSLEALASVIGVSRSNISLIERGQFLRCVTTV
ncbi:helix-turn-helix domain-containing protein [Massilia sp. CCM 8694]|uniref:Helix-turn-helix domain-containing protein n=1 Tax=Massilia genomosp. 1 TaxID=2609280 RepID=A0ABX0MQ55_9BURK|nr:helix-turn-helix domain-containing protein [Massilia genomosp. 1]